jgi:hypothetical protein
MLPPGEAAEHIAPSSASSETQAESDLFDGAYICTVKLIRGIPVVTTILRPCAGASSSSSSALSSDQGSSEDQPRPPIKGHLYGGPEQRSAPPQLQRVSHHQEV